MTQVFDVGMVNQHSEGATSPSEPDENLAQYGSALAEALFVSSEGQAIANEVKGIEAPETEILRSKNLPRLTEIRNDRPLRVTRKRVVQRYTGVVEEIEGEVFRGRVLPTGSNEELVADFAVDEVSEDDQSLLRPGAWFYVSVEQERSPDGRLSTVSSLRFRRLKIWAQEEVDTARERAEKLTQALGISDGH